MATVATVEQTRKRMIFLKTLNEIVQAITSPSILDELAELIRAHDKTFPQEEAIYHEAVEDLRKTVSPHSVDEYIRACQTEVVANILYAAYEGYRANLVNFYSPCATVFLGWISQTTSETT